VRPRRCRLTDVSFGRPNDGLELVLVIGRSCSQAPDVVANARKLFERKRNRHRHAPAR
jgi:hypothetical protein